MNWRRAQPFKRNSLMASTALVALASFLMMGAAAFDGTSDAQEPVAQIAAPIVTESVADEARKLVGEVGGEQVGAEVSLGVIYLTGQLGLADKAEASRWFDLAADAGNPYALYLRVRMSEEAGIGSNPESVLKDAARLTQLSQDIPQLKGRVAALMGRLVRAGQPAAVAPQSSASEEPAAPQATVAPVASPVAPVVAQESAPSAVAAAPAAQATPGEASGDGLVNGLIAGIEAEGGKIASVGPVAPESAPAKTADETYVPAGVDFGGGVDAKAEAERIAKEESQEQAEYEAAIALDEAVKAEEAAKAEEARKAEEAKAAAAEEARKAEEVKKAEEGRKAEEAKQAAAAEEARKTEEAKKAQEAKAAESKRKAQEAKAPEKKRKAEEAKAAEKKRKAEEAKKAEEAQKIEEAKKAADAKQADEAKKVETVSNDVERGGSDRGGLGDRRAAEEASRDKPAVAKDPEVSVKPVVEAPVVAAPSEPAAVESMPNAGMAEFQRMVAEAQAQRDKEVPATVEPAPAAPVESAASSGMVNSAGQTLAEIPQAGMPSAAVLQQMAMAQTAPAAAPTGNSLMVARGNKSALMARFATLLEEHGAVMEGLSPDVKQVATAGGVTFVLSISGFKDASQMQAVCGIFKVKRCELQ